MFRITGFPLLLLITAHHHVCAVDEAAITRQDQAVFFRETVLPILREHCFACHSHAAGEISNGLALDWRSGWEQGGARGPAIVPGDPTQSLLIRAIGHEDPDLKMPEEKLSDEAIAALTRWVAEGAFDDRIARPESSHDDPTDWWSLQPLEIPPIPKSASTNPIDAFIQRTLTEAGLALSPEADRRTLIRRATFDLHGLPPTPEEVDDFVSDEAPDAWNRLVDRLLDSPRYGERWARHWLDTIHFADTHGFEHDVARDHAWRYRDYVIDALNGDTPWGDMIREQLAADVFRSDQPELTAALGFLGAGPFDLSAYSTAPVTFEYIDRDDLVTQTAAAFLSTTANCARCHAHKFDPITQEDYYALQAVFAGLMKGDIRYDASAPVAVERRRLNSLLQAIDRRDPAVLLADEHQAVIRDWVASQRNAARWYPMKPDVFLSENGADLTRIDEHALLADGPRPDTDTYHLTGSVPGERLTAIRLDVLAHDSQPMRGPGRQDNGNLHLSEIRAQVFVPGNERPTPLTFRAATADFNQSGWEIDKAIDGNEQSAWGIFPQVGQSHYGVFELAEPVDIVPGSRLLVSLVQVHGGGHLIGALSVSVTGNHPSEAIAIPSDVAGSLEALDGAATEEQRLALAAFALRRETENVLRNLPPQAVVYAAAASAAIPTEQGQTQLRSIETPRTVHVLQRGDIEKPMDEAPPGTLSVLSHLPSRFDGSQTATDPARRAALAEWIAHRDNVLTWRSIVNRVWHYHFGRGLCDTPSDFGRMGGVPSHPELLDWLAVWFRDDAGGSLKQLHRLILTSHTYRQASAMRQDAVAVDSDNHLLARQNRMRLDAECFRDFTLAVSGRLDLTQGGPGIRHFSSRKGPQSTPTLDYSEFDWNGPGAGRRSIYRFVWRGIPDPMMEVLDFPDLGLLSPQRAFSASSLQALALYNNDFVLHHADAFAERVRKEDPDPRRQIIRAVRLVWQREPTADELQQFEDFAARHSLEALCRVLLNSNEFLFID